MGTDSIKAPLNYILDLLQEVRFRSKAFWILFKSCIPNMIADYPISYPIIVAVLIYP